MIALCEIEITDLMTARWEFLSYGFIEQVFTRIINEIVAVYSLLYDVYRKLAATINGVQLLLFQTMTRNNSHFYCIL